MFEFILKRPALTLALGVSALLGPGLVAVWLFTGDIGTDFGVYWRTANGPLSEAYSDAFDYPFPYAPTMLLWVKPLAYLPVMVAFYSWLIVSVAALAVACRKYLPWQATALVLVSPPLVNGLATGQVSCFIAALMMWACGARNRLLAGVVFGIIATIKPQLVLLAPLMFIVSRDWKALIGSAVSFVAVLVATLTTFGIGIWASWFDGFGYFHHVLIERKIIGSVPTLAGQAEWWGLPSLPFLLLGISLGAWLIWTCRRTGPLARCAAIATGSLLAAPYALTYDLAPIIPFLVAGAFANRIAAAVAMSGALHPLPLLLSSFELWRSHGLGRSVPETAAVVEGADPAGRVGPDRVPAVV